MAFCPNCGSVVTDFNSYCEVCGQVVVPVSQGFLSSFAPLPANKEESIKLCNALASKYATYEKIKEEIHDLEFSIKKMEVKPNAPRYSFFRFYWPFFLIALGACFFSTLIVAFLTMSVDYEVGELLSRLAGYLSIPVVLVIGIVVAKIRQRKANDRLAENEMGITSQISAMRAKVNDLKREQNQLSDELQGYKDIIPVNMRNKDSILKIKKVLDLSQAETIEQAIELIKHPVRG